MSGLLLGMVIIIIIIIIDAYFDYKISS